MTTLFRGDGGGVLRLPDDTSLMRGDECCCDTTPCENCESGTQPSGIVVRLGGVTGTFYGCDCTTMNTDFEVPYNAGISGGCTYADSFYTVASPSCGGFGMGIDITIIIGNSGGTATVYHRNSGGLAEFEKTWTGPIDCSTDILGAWTRTNGWHPLYGCDGTATTLEIISVV